MLKDWQQFILDHGYRALARDLAAVLGCSEDDVDCIRRMCACRKLRHRKPFAELFSLWHGRGPEENDWPAPRKRAGRGHEWLPPEDTLLATLVGQLGPEEIATILTKRLREKTGDRGAKRNRQAVLSRINVIGLQVSKDVLGGITVAEAGREIGSLAVIYRAISAGGLTARRVGRQLVIPHKAWKDWKAGRVFPPKGFVQLSSIKQPLSIRSDKLSEFARMGYVPSAVHCTPAVSSTSSSKWGTWYIDKAVADRLVKDRQAGRPMPWHAKPLLDNLRVTYRLWTKRKHPPSCKTCAKIWGKKSPPKTFEAYVLRYSSLAKGQKRHLTMPWSPGMSVAEVAAHTGRSRQHVMRAIRNGALTATKVRGKHFVTRTEATLWKTRRCPMGNRIISWISVETASKRYLFSTSQIRQFIASGRLKSKRGNAGAAYGIVYVSKIQCSRLRAQIGFSERDAARRAGVSVARLRQMLEGLNWRKTGAIPLVTVQALIKRLQAKEGYTLEEAARILRKPVQWVRDRQHDGTIRVLRGKKDRRRLYITEPMLGRLKAAKRKPVGQRLGPDWLRVSAAAMEAGVTQGTVEKWAALGELDRRQSPNGWRYRRKAIRARARSYWRSVRFHRAVPPAWLQAEMEAAGKGAGPGQIRGGTHHRATHLSEAQA